MQCRVCGYDGPSLNESKGLDFSIMGYMVEDVTLYEIDACQKCGVVQVIQGLKGSTRNE